MLAAWNSVLAGLPVLLAQLATTTGLFVVGLGIYIAVTPYKEIELIRAGNVAAAVSLCGEMLALAIPLAAMMAHSVSLADIILWGVVALLLQLAVFGVVAVLLRGIANAIDMAPQLQSAR